ncbi:MAG TPA: bifunctional demethylmenaquinone methyltransferase/2-methoxy-6-polyprenyl-1,4-benzoquinol methylase UbiE [Pyrinomonadaceae bacterium]|nr:bifunctional demethylmenaquinone methyltransferase/2-methoxy-6-polyprenyl-1,4-benzoquinol methylase UbiE [Pyrinomonadaceae bacterium]
MSEQRQAIDSEHSSRVREMFAAIAGRYDLLNHLLSVHLDKRWRLLVARRLQGKIGSRPARILDVACGTADLSLTLFETTGARVFGADFCRPMLAIAARKISRHELELPLIEADALDLPFSDHSFDGVTIAFGLRNLANVTLGLQELLRVLKPGGHLAVLEFSKPVVPGFNFLFKVYFTRILPRLGGLISGSKSAYQYLPASVSRFPDQDGLSDLMQHVGFRDIEYENLTGGVAALHLGRRADD